MMTYRINSEWIRTRGIVKVICWIQSPASLVLQCVEAANQMKGQQSAEGLQRSQITLHGTQKIAKLTHSWDANQIQRC